MLKESQIDGSLAPSDPESWQNYLDNQGELFLFEPETNLLIETLDPEDEKLKVGKKVSNDGTELLTAEEEVDLAKKIEAAKAAVKELKDRGEITFRERFEELQ